MRVLFIVRHTFYSVNGGDTTQVMETARHLKILGIETDIKLCTDKIEYHPYTFLHFFNITRPADMLCHIKKSGKPFFVSSIYIDYSVYDKNHRKGFSGFLFRFLSADGVEYLKTVYRFLAGADKLVSPSYLWKGQKKSIKEVLRKATCVLVQANDEYLLLQKRYKAGIPYHIIHNGIDTTLFYPGDEPKDSNLVICAARIEGIKNQYNLIHALNNTEYKLLLIGNAAPNQQKYYDVCKKLAAGNVSFIKHLPQTELVTCFKKAKVHILPSWFEVCGLSSLEAAAMGCNIVITGNGFAKEYFKDMAFYCNPGDMASIRNAVKTAANEPVNPALQNHVITNYTWQNAAIKTAEVYKKYSL